jgi:hypothetical protein
MLTDGLVLQVLRGGLLDYLTMAIGLQFFSAIELSEHRISY